MEGSRPTEARPCNARPVRRIKNGPVTASQVTKLLRESCGEASPPKRRGHANKKPVYWWTPEIAELRRWCLRARRRYVRMHKKMRERSDDFYRSLQEYNEAKGMYKRKIMESKRSSWRALCESVREDVWGLPYKIIRDRIEFKRLDIPETKVEAAVRELFPAGREFPRERIEVDADDIPEVSSTEIVTAAERIAAGKAPGPDGVYLR